MTEGERPWIVRLTAAAEADYQNIIAWTLGQFGDLQARVHADTLSAALVELTAGPTTVGAKERSEIGKGIFTLHAARGGRKGRHFVLFRIGPDNPQSQIEVLRLLHDAMDLKLQTPGT
jgi:toxin ParE1/3/4